MYCDNKAIIPVRIAPDESDPFCEIRDIFRSSIKPIPVGFFMISGRNFAIIRYTIIEIITGLRVSCSNIYVLKENFSPISTLMLFLGMLCFLQKFPHVALNVQRLPLRVVD